MNWIPGQVALVLLALVFPLSLDATQPLFDTWLSYEVGNFPLVVIAADLDGDGDGDLVTANRGYRWVQDDSTVSVLTNNGDGTFAPRVDYTAGYRPISVVACDWDRDGDKDLAVTSEDGNLYLLFNDGNAVFNTKTAYFLGGDFLSSVFAGDLDGDEDPDAVVADYSGRKLYVLMNDGRGKLDVQAEYALSLAPTAVAAADLDGDEDLDLAATYETGEHKVFTLVNEGNGTFMFGGGYGAPAIGGRALYVSDLDGDGNPDLAVADSYDSTVSVLKNDGFGSFLEENSFRVGRNPYSVFASDVNGDGAFDLAVANAHEHSVSILINNGNGSF
ncbi:MAG: FG-GAP repeat domain-containing protein, partial [Candidatus Zixiibacteriota bacterium]